MRILVSLMLSLGFEALAQLCEQRERLADAGGRDALRQRPCPGHLALHGLGVSRPACLRQHHQMGAPVMRVGLEAQQALALHLID
jgi:hypothetical protein